MKTIRLLFITFLGIFSSLASYSQCPISAGRPCPGNGSRIWFVNPVSTVHADTNYLQRMIDHPDVVDGDTIYVEQSLTSHGTIHVDKRLTIIGSGWHLGINDSMQANQNATNTGYVYFDEGSQGSVFMGFQVNGVLTINVDSITIQHNYIWNNIDNNTYCVDINGGTVDAPRQRVMLFQNYIYKRRTTRHGAIRIDNVCELLYIENNIIMSSSGSWSWGHADVNAIIMTDDNSNAFIRNNVIYGNLDLRNAVFENNIVAGAYCSYTNYSYGHTWNNMSNRDIFPNGTPQDHDNQNSVDLSTVFNCYNSLHNTTVVVPDTCFWLQAGCLAVDAGYGNSILDGTVMDLGIYDGNIPYSESGMPFIPSIFYFDGPSVISDPTMSIRVKARTHH